MRAITLNKMRIENFKGISSLGIQLDGKNTLISGFNGTGKSTIADAYFWVTTGKNAAGNARFEVRPRDKHGNEVHDVITSVECEFSVVEDNGDAFTFSIKREELEDLTEKAKQQLKPETIASKKSYYFIDNAPYDAKIFYDKLGKIMCDKDKFSILSNPMAFFMLKEPEQRELLTMACGDVQDSEVEGYEQVKAICGAINTPAQVKEGLADSIRKANKRIDEIPAQVKVLSQNCDEYAEYDNQIAELVEQRISIVEQNKIEYAELQQFYAAMQSQAIEEPHDYSVIEAQHDVERLQQDIASAEKAIHDWEELEKSKLCPNCGAKLADYSNEIIKQKNKRDCNKEFLKIAKIGLQQAKEQYEKAKQEYQENIIQTEKVRDARNAEIKAHEDKRDKLRQQYDDLTSQILKLEQAQKVQSQIKALRDEQRKLDDQLADDITKHDIISAFLLKKAEKVVENINSGFTTVQFKLFEMQANGELKACCKAMKDGVSYANINTASKVQVGVELANLFSEFYGVTTPIWIDCAESVFDIPETKAQRIRLKAVEPEKKEVKREDYETDEAFEAAKMETEIEYEKAKEELHIEADND